jgi:hypothetical protein
MNGEDERLPQSFSWARRWSAGLNLIVTVLAVLALVAMANYLAIRHFKRFHWSQATENQLSQRTLTILGSLTNTVKIIVYFDSSPDNALFPRVRGLLREYQNASPRVQIQYVDYLRDVFEWAYERSCARYSAVRQSLWAPDAFRLHYRDRLKEVVAAVVRGGLDKRAAAGFVRRESEKLPAVADRPRFAELAESELSSLHEGNFARYRLRPAEFAAWQKTWR